jgi:hypothetical protein
VDEVVGQFFSPETIEKVRDVHLDIPVEQRIKRSLVNESSAHGTQKRLNLETFAH